MVVLGCGIVYMRSESDSSSERLHGSATGVVAA